MRTESKSNITLSYPDEIGFAFNPCIVKIDGDKVTKAIIRMDASGSGSDVVMFDAFRGKIYGDVREYIQTFFDSVPFGKVNYEEAERTELGKMVSFEVVVSVSGSDDVTFSFSVFYVWGALKIGGVERYNGFRRLKWFKGYPFTFGVYAAGGSSVLFGKDGAAEKFVSLSDQGVWNIPLKDSEHTAKNFYLISDSTGGLREVNFDRTFDLTFRFQYVGDGKKTDKVRIDIVDDYDEGYYLRWINRHGFYCYYLFKAGEQSRKVSSDSAYLRNNLLSYDMTYGYEGGAGRMQSMKSEDSLPICAPLVDSETWDMLFDVTTSPIVDMFAGYEGGVPKWVSVNVVAASYTKGGAPLQDFICTIALPEVEIQKL